MPGSDRCAATRPSRARVGPQTHDRGAVASPSPSRARVEPQNRTMQARKPGPYPRRPPRAAGRPDDFADHSSGYPRPSHVAGRPDDFADHSSGYPRPSRAAGRFYARQRPLRRHPPLPRAAGRKIERRRHGSRGRTPAVSDRRRGQGCRAARRIGADSVFLCDGGALYQERGRERRGGAGGDGRSGRAHGMEERMMAGPGGGNGKNGRESGRARREKGEEESGRARRGGRAGAEETEP